MSQLYGYPPQNQYPQPYRPQGPGYGQPPAYYPPPPPPNQFAGPSLFPPPQRPLAGPSFYPSLQPPSNNLFGQLGLPSQGSGGLSPNILQLLSQFLQAGGGATSVAVGNKTSADLNKAFTDKLAQNKTDLTDLASAKTPDQLVKDIQALDPLASGTQSKVADFVKDSATIRANALKTANKTFENKLLDSELTREKSMDAFLDTNKDASGIADLKQLEQDRRNLANQQLSLLGKGFDEAVKLTNASTAPDTPQSKAYFDKVNQLNTQYNQLATQRAAKEKAIADKMKAIDANAKPEDLNNAPPKDLLAVEGNYYYNLDAKNDATIRQQYIGTARQSLKSISDNLKNSVADMEPESPSALAAQARVAAIQQLDKALEMNAERVDDQNRMVSSELGHESKINDFVTSHLGNSNVDGILNKEKQEGSNFFQRLNLMNGLGALFTISANLAPGSTSRQAIDQRVGQLNTAYNSLESKRFDLESGEISDIKSADSTFAIDGPRQKLTDYFQEQGQQLIGIGIRSDYRLQKDFIGTARKSIANVKATLQKQRDALGDSSSSATALDARLKAIDTLDKALDSKEKDAAERLTFSDTLVQQSDLIETFIDKNQTNDKVGKLLSDVVAQHKLTPQLDQLNSVLGALFTISANLTPDSPTSIALQARIDTIETLLHSKVDEAKAKEPDIQSDGKSIDPTFNYPPLPQLTN